MYFRIFTFRIQSPLSSPPLQSSPQSSAHGRPAASCCSPAHRSSLIAHCLLLAVDAHRMLLAVDAHRLPLDVDAHHLPLTGVTAVATFQSPDHLKIEIIAVPKLQKSRWLKKGLACTISNQRLNIIPQVKYQRREEIAAISSPGSFYDLCYKDWLKLPLFWALPGSSAVSGGRLIRFADDLVITSIVILGALFSIQPFGSSKVGFTFAPALAIWFFSLGSIGNYVC
nr:putative potassium transporter 12 [Ipomoea trifida]